MRATTLVSTTAAVAATVSIVHLAAQLTDRDGLADVTQVMLMPTVAGWLAARTSGAPRPRIVRRFLLGLGFSWLGDTAPRFLDGDAGFLAMVGFFLVAQVVYASAFWPLRQGSAAVRAPWSLLAYAAALAMIVALCAGEAGPLLPALLVYAGALVTTSVLAWGAGPVAGVGGVVFLASDAMIGLRAFAPSFDPPQEGFLIMSTYIAAQVLLAHAVAQHAQPGRAGTRTPLPRARAAR
ncbi:lysoplasmalogenase [Sanguibacter hominis ATCC BAA-789]|uniref:Lysoplasmalogenase n=1 Tax=Sanguibacter hominis ATCC BAA-789 TaxID=1312740 RepID=A0A9X5IPG5_9MICO|nr:lysoplasmalogenase [Sanguibacter hominis ATCC BAA-789]